MSEQVDLLARASSLLHDHEPGHDDTQIALWVIKKNGLTPWGEYRQCLREIDKRFSALENCVIDLDENRQRIADLHVTDRGPVRDCALRRANIEKLAILQRRRTLTRELEVFVELAEQRRSELGEITPERRVDLDREFWIRKLAFQAKAELLATGTMSANLLELLACLPGDEQAAILESIHATLPADATRLEAIPKLLPQD